ncbi:hypothetical protein PsYK624_148000 [Phanerochaete sordida]|uniref:BTB domain-containing protein n=1 Tax=Phanerochaete sordida TaxID=48140 RepID=A0A9P3GN80_9APHY|nr:hypothetical protein PsYK624_148000 [Phanerochaete sordida]
MAMNFHEAFNSPTADVILRSSDDIHFRAHRLILSEASVVFAGMFSLPVLPPMAPPSSSPNEEAKLPIVDLSEDGETLSGLLHVLYPGKPLQAPELGVLRKMLAAAEKYMILGAKTLLGGLLLGQGLLETEPMRVYAVACRFRLCDAAILAAKATLKHPPLGLACPELEDLPAVAYLDLLRYREQRLNNTHRLDAHKLWKDNFKNRSPPHCGNCATKWWNNAYLPYVKDTLRRCTSSTALMSLECVQHVSGIVSAACITCQQEMGTIFDLHTTVVVAVDKDIANAKFEPSW